MLQTLDEPEDDVRLEEEENANELEDDDVIVSAMPQHSKTQHKKEEFDFSSAQKPKTDQPSSFITPSSVQIAAQFKTSAQSNPEEVRQARSKTRKLKVVEKSVGKSPSSSSVPGRFMPKNMLVEPPKTKALF